MRERKDLLQEGLYPLDLMLSNPQSRRMFNIKGSTLGSKICHLEPHPKCLPLFAQYRRPKSFHFLATATLDTGKPHPPYFIARKRTSSES
jgi:hypothetical protein